MQAWMNDREEECSVLVKRYLERQGFAYVLHGKMRQLMKFRLYHPLRVLENLQHYSWSHHLEPIVPMIETFRQGGTPLLAPEIFEIESYQRK
jgi:hypothetical protein